MAQRHNPARRLTLLYDETCHFCTALAEWFVRRSGGAVEAHPIGSPLGSQALRDVAVNRRYDSIHVLDAVGRRRSGAESLPELCRAVPGLGWAAWLARAFPGVARLGYAYVARNRRLISRLFPLRRASRGRAD